ncbi:MAG TPA: hypothetical protein PKA64_19755, partial [Myxococcota bacterium]|nr:hypothetical protein [Myxococcota bacterium]
MEAGVLLDTRDGDNNDELARIAEAIDRWFEERPPGFFPVADSAAVDSLVSLGVLAKAVEPVESRRPSRTSASGDTLMLYNLKPLL